MTVSEFCKKHGDLEDRYSEQELFTQRASGKRIRWRVVADRPRTYHDSVTLGFNVPTEKSGELTRNSPVSFIDFPLGLRDRLYQLRRGDLIEVDGTLRQIGSSNQLKIDGHDFEVIIAPSSSPSPSPAATVPENSALGMSLEAYNNKIESASFEERQQLLSDVGGKLVNWKVRAESVATRESGVTIFFHPIEGGSLGTAAFDESQKARALSLKRGDTITLIGTIRKGSWRDVDGQSFELLAEPAAASTSRTTTPAPEYYATRFRNTTKAGVFLQVLRDGEWRCDRTVITDDVVKSKSSKLTFRLCPEHKSGYPAAASQWTVDAEPLGSSPPSYTFRLNRFQKITIDP